MQTNLTILRKESKAGRVGYFGKAVLAISFAVAVAVTTTGSAYAQQESRQSDAGLQQTQVMTLKECMEYAVSNSTKMRIAKTETHDAQRERRDAILEAFTPGISGSAGAGYNYGRSIDPETNSYRSTTSFSNSYSVSGSITLFNGFQAINNMKIAKTAKLMGISREQQTEDEVCLATMEAYYNVVYYKAMIQARKVQVEAAQNNLKKAKIEEQLGQKGYADVVQIEADLADNEYNLINTENMYNDALLTLKDIMFWPVNEPLEIDYSMVGEHSLKQQSDAIQGGIYADDQAQVTDNAINFLPKAALAKGEMENAKRSFNTAKWQLLPTLSVGGGWSTSYFTYPGLDGYKAVSFRDQFTNNGGEYISMSLSIPIFNRLSRQSNITRKRNAYKRATAQYDQTMREIESEVKRALQDKTGAGAAFVQAYKKAEVQNEAYKYNTKKFEQGLISPIEYQTASTNYLQAKAERLNSLLNYYLKRSVVEYYNGVPYREQTL